MLIYTVKFSNYLKFSGSWKCLVSRVVLLLRVK